MSGLLVDSERIVTHSVPVARQFVPALTLLGKAMPIDISLPGGIAAYRSAAQARATTADVIAERWSLAARESVVGGLPITVFRPQATVVARVVFVHGGGLIAGNRFDGVDVVARHAEKLGLEVWSVEYPLAPEHDFDTMAETVLAVVASAAEEDMRVLIAGQSAGGGIAAEVALRAATRGVPLGGQLLVCPMLARADDESARPFHGDCSWSAANNVTAWAAALRSGGSVPPGERASLPALAPTYLDAGSAELFRDAISGFATALWQRGNRAELHIWSGGFHGFDCAAEDASGSAEAHRTRGDWIRRWLDEEL